MVAAAALATPGHGAGPIRPGRGGVGSGRLGMAADLLPPPRTGRGSDEISLAQAALPFCFLKKASARFASSSVVRSSLCVAILQVLPEGSFTAPQRSVKHVCRLR